MLSAICFSLDQSKILSSCNGLKRSLLLACKNAGLSAIWILTFQHTVPTFNNTGKKSLLKKAVLVTSIFSFSYNAFYPIKEKLLSAVFLLHPMNINLTRFHTMTPFDAPWKQAF